MKFSKRILLLFTVLFTSIFSIAQQTENKSKEEKYRAVHWTIQDGLSDPMNYFFIKDIHGFLWTGSDHSGLNRFDGSLFKKYYHDPHDNRTIAGNVIAGLIEDSLHNIWVGSERGLSRYDIKADTFSNFYTGENPDHIFIPFWATRDEVYALESDFRIVKFNVHSFTKKALADLTTADSLGHALNVPYSVFDSSSNSIWMSRGQIGAPGGGLLNVSLSDGAKKYYRWPCYRNIPGHSHFPEAMCYDRKRNSIWINSSDGLLEFTLADKKFHHIDALNEFVKLKDYHHWVGIDIDLQGRVWLATNKGVLVYDPSDQSLNLPFAQDAVLQNDVSENNAIVYCDKDEIIWAGFWSPKGIYQFIPFSPVVKLFTPDPKQPLGFGNNQVITITQTDHERLWIGTLGELYVFDPTINELRAFKQKDLPGLGRYKIVLPQMIDTNLNKAWVHTEAGYFEMDLKTKKCRPIIFKDSLDKPINSPEYPFHVSFRGSLITIASYNDRECIFTLNKDSAIARESLNVPNNGINLLYSNTDDDHLLFLKREEAMGNLTFTYINNKWLQIPHPMDSIQWTSIFFNKKDMTYWVAAERKLIHYNKDFKVMHSFSTQDGLPDIGITGLIADNKGNIWFHTDRFIHQLNIETGEISTLSEKDGFEKQNFELVKFNYKDDNGDIYFPGGLFGSGFDRISPDKYTNPPSTIYLQSLEVNQKPFPLATGINDLKELSLSYSQNKISIETGVIDYYSRGKNRIRYKLEGLNNNWQYAPAYYTIRYDGLSASNYKLIIQAANAANEFNGPVKTLLISITPAFWNTWWFRILAAICVLTLFYAIIRYRTKQKFKLQLEHSEKEKELAELKQEKTEVEMQALRAQMNPHFIFNSLNSINRFILQNNKTQASEYLTKFSRLVRLILQNSQAAFITLESELEALQLYLELERLRCEEKFSFKVKVDPDIDTDFIQVPPMLLQPFVENAIWHGLMNKEGEGHLSISIYQEDLILLCAITDDGVGRKKSVELKDKSGKHKSMGMKITESRIAMMQKMNGENKSIGIRDLVDTYGNAAGTEVVLRIPLSKK